MKATAKMLDSACEVSPNLQREHVARIVQAALDADERLSNIDRRDLLHGESDRVVIRDGAITDSNPCTDENDDFFSFERERVRLENQVELGVAHLLQLTGAEAFGWRFNDDKLGAITFGVNRLERADS